MNAWQAHRALSAEQKQIVKTKQVDLNRPADELLAMLKPLATYDRTVDKARKPLGCTAGLTIVLSFFSLFFLIGVPFGRVIVGLLVLVAVASLAGWFWTRSGDLSDNLRVALLPILGMLREDFDPAHPVHIHLDLRSPTDKAKKTREEPPYKKGAYHKIVDTYFEDPWMSGEGVLNDGTRLRWSITDTIRERKKTKRTARGKYKSKTKYAKKSDIEVQVAMKKKVYELAGAPDGEMKSDEKKNTVTIAKRLRSPSLDPVAPHEVIDAIAGVYRKARPAGKGA